MQTIKFVFFHHVNSEKSFERGDAVFNYGTVIVVVVGLLCFLLLFLLIWIFLCVWAGMLFCLFVSFFLLVWIFSFFGGVGGGGGGVLFPPMSGDRRSP